MSPEAAQNPGGPGEKMGEKGSPTPHSGERLVQILVLWSQTS